MYDFAVDYKTFDTSNIIDIHKYLVKNHDVWGIQKMFIGSLIDLVNGFNHTKCVLLSNQKGMT